MDNILQSSLDDHLNDSLELKYESCFYCCGFYGPCFGEPVCGVCHDFIFSEDFGSYRQMSRSDSDIGKDDGDSGNDEPSEDAVPLPVFPIDLAGGLPGSGDYLLPSMPWPQSPQSSNQASPSDRLAKRVNQLTTHWSTTDESSNRDNSHRIPPEIWAIIFRMLDDISLFMASKVSPRWKTIITDQYPSARWEEFVKKRWPLFNPIYTVFDWYSVYSDFLESVPCKLCFMDLNSVLPVPTGSRSLRSVRLYKEIKLMRVDHPEGIEAIPLDNLNYNWLARVNGPPQSPYQGGVFYLNLKISHDYPLKPPGVRFLTKIFHPNISRHGDIGIDCIQHNWTLALTIPQILLSVQSLLTDPFLEISMEKTVAELYEKDIQTFDKIARIWTWKYAMHDVLIH
ncbi:unnamed protein product [Allacma fusca]|uniref:E2 ubiquitin-conjugating enzyme n=1 Tax=Allacma fusca TaxID=39272 RepID=A0A8J2K1K3_9HEXA|nr:unnamed protein product [Allacma fusca]